MRHIVAPALISFSLSVGPAAIAQTPEFTTAAAKAAKAQYEADLQAAREKYLAALDQAAVKAAQEGQLEEVVRIKAEKDRLTGKQPTGEPTERVLWKHRGGYFERLNDGFWIERVSDGTANIFAQSTNNNEYIEISRPGVIVRLFNNHTMALFHGRDKDFKPLYRGGWAKR